VYCILKTDAAVTVAWTIDARKLPEKESIQSAGVSYSLLLQCVDYTLKDRDDDGDEGLNLISDLVLLALKVDIHGLPLPAFLCCNARCLSVSSAPHGVRLGQFDAADAGAGLSLNSV
jgi:hypothetical protein